MTRVLWSVLALVAALGVAMIALRRAQRRIPPPVLEPGESIPTTALQRLARTSLLLATLLSSAAGIIVAYHGAQVFWDNDRVRLTVTGLMIAALGIYVVYMSRVARWIAKDDGTLDERDRAILESAPAGQAPAMLVTLAAWTIALTEAYRDAHLIPSVFLYLVFWSCLMVSVLMLILGVVIGYRRQ